MQGSYSSAGFEFVGRSSGPESSSPSPVATKEKSGIKCSSQSDDSPERDMSTKSKLNSTLPAEFNCYKGDERNEQANFESWIPVGS